VCNMTKDEPNLQHYRDYKGIDVKRLSRHVVEQNWTPICNLPDVNEQVCYFNDLVLSLRTMALVQLYNR
jgi:hypothetical protein